MIINSAEEFKKYVESDDEDEYRKTQWNASEEVWLDVLNKYPEYSRTVAFNLSITMNVLEKLSESDDWKTRVDVAMKRRISHKIFEKLSKDIESVVRRKIAVNAKAPDYILEHLALDTDVAVSSIAKDRLKERLLKK